MDTFTAVGEVDYDPFAAEAAPAAPATETATPPPTMAAPPTPPAAPTEEAQTQPDYVIPAASSFKIPKIVRQEELDAQQAAAKGPVYVAAKEVDFDPFEQGTMPLEAGKAVAAGATETTGTMLKGLAGQRQQEMTDRRAEAARAKWLQDNGYTGLTVIADLPPEKQQALRQAMAGANAEALKEMNLEDDLFYKMGVATTDWSKEKFKAAHDYEDSWTRKLGEGFGSIAPYIAVNFVPGVGQVASLEAGYASAVGTQIDDAIAKGATKEQILDAMRYGGVGGLTEQVPIDVLFERIPLPAMGKVLGAIAKVGATAFAEGGQEAVQQVWQNLVAKYNYDPKQDVMEGVAESALIGGIVGGAVAVPTAHRNHGREQPPKVDDTPGTAAPAQEEGTPAAPTPAAGVPTPGGTGQIAQPPEGSEKQPATPPVETPISSQDPRTDVKPPQPAAAAAPAAVAAPVDPTLAAALASATGAGPANTPGAAPAVSPAVDIDESEVELEAPVPSAAEERLSAMFKPVLAREQQQEAAARTTVVKPANSDINIALAAAQPAAQPAPSSPADLAATMRPVPQATVAPGAETVGTGQALQPLTPPVGAPPAEVAGEPALEPGTVAQPAAPSAPPIQVQQPADVALTSQEPTAPASAPAPLAPAEAAEVPVAFTAVREVEHDPFAGEMPAAEPSPIAAAPVARTKADALKEKAASKRALKEAAALDRLAAKQAREAAHNAPKPAELKPTAEPIAEPTPAAVTAEPAERAEVKPAPAQPGRGEPAQAPAAGRLTLPGARQAPIAPATQTRRERAAAPPTRAETEPTPAPPRQERLARDAERAAHDILDSTSTVSELPEYRQVLREVADQEAAAVPRGTPPAKAIRDTAAKVAGAVKQRLAQAQEAHDVANIRTEEAVTVYGRKQQEKAAAKEARAAELAVATAPQKRERAGKNKGKSAEGIRTEDVESTRRAVEANAKLPPERQDRLVTAWGMLDARQKLLRGDNMLTPEEKKAELAQVAERKEQLKEMRAQAAERAQAESRLNERAQSVKDTLEPAAAKIPIPPLSERSPLRGSDREVAERAAAAKHLRDYYDAVTNALKTKGLQLAHHIDTKHQSSVENLAIFARKIMRRVEEAGLGPVNFIAARKLQEAGFNDELYGMITSEVMPGTGQGLEAGEASNARARLDIEPSRVREDTALESRVRVAREVRSAPSPDEEFLRREAPRETRPPAGERELSVTRPDGSTVTVQATTRKARTVLRELKPGGSGFLGMLRSMHLRHLTQLVGDVDVHLISDADMMTLTGQDARGLHYNYSDAMRAAGHQPQVFISESESGADYTHTVLHELTHAATSQAIRDNIRGTADIMDALMDGLDAPAKGRFPNALSTHAEFIAEAFSNPEFQEFLQTTRVSGSVRRELAGLSRSGRPTLWQAFTAAVSNALGMISGARGQTYMESVVALSPQLMRSSEAQLATARETVATPKLPSALPTQPFDVDYLLKEFDTSTTGVIASKLKQAGGHTATRWSSTGQLMRSTLEDWGNKLGYRLGELALKKEELFRQRRKNPGQRRDGSTIDNEKIESDLLDYSNENPTEARKIGEWINTNSTYKVHGGLPINDPRNGHISKAGIRSAMQRRVHAQMAAEYDNFSAKGKEIIRQLDQHYGETHDLLQRAIIKDAVDSALANSSSKLPAGKTVDDVIEWVRSGGARRKEDERTPEDKLYRAALGRSAEALANVRELGKLPGLYAPQGRTGRYFITATEKVIDPNNLPAGAVQLTDNRLAFADRKDLESWLDSYGDENFVSTGTAYFNPVTGKMTTSLDDDARKLWVATIQNQRLESSDDQVHLLQRIKELRAEGLEPSTLQESGTRLRMVAEQISSGQIKRLLRGADALRKGASADNFKDAVVDLHTQQLLSQSAMKAQLKRRNVLGAPTDMFENLRGYNKRTGNHLANLELNKDIHAADNAAQEWIDQDAKNQGGKVDRTLKYNRQLAELRKRVTSAGTADRPGTVQEVATQLRNFAVLKSLASIHFNIVNALQNWTMAIPTAAAHHGWGMTIREYHRAGRLGGGRTKAWLRSAVETSKAAKNIFTGSTVRDDLARRWHDLVAKEPDGAELQDLYKYMHDHGGGASNGQENPQLSMLDIGPVKRTIQRTVDAGLASATVQEDLNRHMTATAEYRMLRREGLPQEEAKIMAFLRVEQTQGIYSASNFNDNFRNPWLQPMLQFRRYSVMAGQLYWGNVMRIFTKTGVERKRAIKTVANITATTAIFAGLFGQAFIEPLRLFVNTLHALGWSDDDWEEKEAKFAEWLRGMIRWGTGSDWLGDKLSEASLHGVTRWLNIDTSNSMGMENLVTFGQPQEMNEAGFWSWIGQMVLGASGKTGVEIVKAINRGDYGGVIPWPKVFKQSYEAIDQMIHGVRNKYTGEQEEDPISAYRALVKITGFKPAEEQRTYEPGGAKFTKKQIKAEWHDRSQLMQRWRNLDRAEQNEFFRSEIAEWNETHPGKLRINYSTLLRSVRSAKARKEEVEQAMEEELE